MGAALERYGSRERLAAADDNARLHPAWRRYIAAGMAGVFALTLALMGVMLCIAPAALP